MKKKFLLSEFEKNGLPPEGYSISGKPTGAVVKRQISKKIEKTMDTVVVHAGIPVKKSKKHLMMYYKMISFIFALIIPSI
jgi:hypothetical protein